MTQNHAKNKIFEQVMAEIMPRLRDVSMRDGQQSWDANRWTNQQTLRVLKYYNDFSKCVTEYCGVTLPEQEVSGGGEYLQPARFLGENPFENLKSRKKYCTHHPIMSLYRGRQAFGFMPVSDEIGYHAIRQSAALGNNMLRVFDMMNDLDNLKPSIEAFLKVRQEQIEYGVSSKEQLRYEIAICYISEPVSGGAVTPEDYANLIVSMLSYAKEKCDLYQNIGAFSDIISVVFKDYAGQCQTKDQISMLVQTARIKMDQAGFHNVHLNIHSHGAKAKILKEALTSGAYKVDTAIGDLADGPSHTNLRDMIALLLMDYGLNIKDYQDHPILLALSDIEKEIALLARIHKPYRMPLEVISAEDIASHKIASGAASALWNLICGRWHRQIKQQIDIADRAGKTDYDLQVDIFIRTLKKIYDPQTDTGIWKDAGQFHTVTPGSTIAYSQALTLVLAECAKRPLALAQHNQTFKDLIKGRYGQNIGLEKGYGDLSLRKAYLLEEALGVLEKSVPTDMYHYILKQSGLGELMQYPNHFAPERESILRDADIDLLRNKVKSSHISETIQEQVLAVSSVKPFPKKEQILEDVFPIIQTLESKNLFFSKESPSFGLSDSRQAALLLTLLYTTDKGYDIGRNMFLFQQDQAQKLGDIEIGRYGDIFQIIQEDIVDIIEDMAKLETLENIAARQIRIQQPVKQATHQGMRQIKERFRKRLRKILGNLAEHGYGRIKNDELYSLHRTKEAIRIFSMTKKDTLIKEMASVPPILW